MAGSVEPSGPTSRQDEARRAASARPGDAAPAGVGPPPPRSKSAPLPSRGTAPRRTTEPSADEPPPWDERLLAIVNNTAKTHPTPGGPVRDRGFLVFSHGPGSLQQAQAVCHRSEQRYNVCLSARYRVRPPILGNLLAALVADLARLARGIEAGAPVGDLLPPTTGLTTPPWATLRSGPFVDLATAAGLDQLSGELTPDWVGRLLGALDQESLLPTGVRLILFAEVDGATQPGDWDRVLAIAPALPERLGIVLSGAPDRLSVPDGMTWDPARVGPTGNCLEIDVQAAPRARAFSYVEAPLSGDMPADVDALDRRRYANGLSRLVLLPGTGPMTIGVHAPWGRGKTSFMRFVEWELICNAPANRSALTERLALATAELAMAESTSTMGERDDARRRRDRALAVLRRRALRDVIPVWFNAWRYEGATQIWAGLTHEITEQLERALPWPRRVWARVVYAVRNQGTAFWIGTVVPTLAALLLTGLVLGLSLGALRADLAGLLPDWAGWLVAVAPSFVVLALAGYLVWRFSRALMPVSERLLDYVRQPDYREHMGYQHQVLRDIQFLTSRLGRDERSPRVVVFIDDLDRCSDEKVLETLQAINLLLTASGCYVFLGIDTHMIAQAVARQYALEQDDGARAESYLRKIIQLSFRLPAPEQDQRLALLAQFFSHQARQEYDARVGRSRAAPPPGAVRGERAPADGPAPTAAYAWSTLDVSTPAVFEVAEVEDTVDELDAFARLRHVVPDNPRELKRLANLHRLVKILVQRPEAPPTVGTQRLLVAWLVHCFVHPDDAEQLLHEARTADGTTVVRSAELDALLERLNEARPADERSVLTAAELAPGTPLAEAAAISALFQERGTPAPQRPAP